MKSVLFVPSQEKIAVNNIFCIGRNYAAHSKELGNMPGESPVVFIKPTSSIVLEGEKIILPKISDDVHHECEVCLLIGKGGKNIPRSASLDHLLGYGIGLDLTMRDVQSEARAKGLPWTISKGFDTSAAISSFVAREEISDPSHIEFTLHVNSELRQKGDTSLMLFPIPFIISYLSSIFTLERGDIIFTGTPEGVAAIESGDRLELRLADRLSCVFDVS